MSEIAKLKEERDEARQIVRDIYWMARRYADGRLSYAPGMFNDAIRKAVEGGWLKPSTDFGKEGIYAREGHISDLETHTTPTVSEARG
jgi:hypothetical protein